MTLHVPGMEEWGTIIRSHDVRPAANVGVVVTPAQNTKVGAAWAEYLDGALVTQDIYGIEINFNSNSRSGGVGNTIVDIGIDESAGTTYQVVIANLLATHASPYNVNAQGYWYYFPLFIPAGSSIAARASVDNATVGSFSSFITLYGKPRYPENIRFGRRVESIGVVTATSEGTVVVAGGASEGTWTSVGTLARDAWWFQLGVGTSDSSLLAGNYDWDVAIGDASNKRILPQPQGRSLVTGTLEQLSLLNNYHGCCCDALAGQTVYVRGQHSGTPDTDVTCAVYALGG